MNRSLVVLVLAISLVSCGSSSTPPSTPAAQSRVPPPAEPPLPSIEGRAITDVPLDRVHPEASAIWADLQRVLADRLPATQTADQAETRQFVADVFLPWFGRRRDATTAMHARLRGWVASPDARVRLFASIVISTLEGDVVDSVRALPPPTPIARVAEGAVEFRATLDRLLGPFAGHAQTALESCVTAARELPWASAWVHHCGERRAQMALVVASATQTPDGSRTRPRAAPPPLPPECTVAEEWRTIEAPAPRMRARPVVAVVDVDGTTDRRFTPAEHDQLLASMTAGAARWLRGRRVLSRDEVRRAEALHAERRLRAGGPVCGQAPPLAAILAATHPHVWLAEVDPICMYTEGRERPCMLQVDLRRAGSTDRTGLPEGTSIDVPGGTEDGPAEPWLRAAATFGRAAPSRVGLLGMLMGRGEGPTRFEVRGAADDDPWLRVGYTLEGAREAILACFPAGSAASYGVRMTISPTGEPTAVQVASRTVAGVASPDTVGSCVAQAITALAFPCTPSGQPVPVETLVCASR